MLKWVCDFMEKASYVMSQSRHIVASEVVQVEP